MVAYAIVDVEIHDIACFLDYQRAVAPLLGLAGARYLARGGECRVYAGDYQPGRLILVEFPSMDVMDDFYTSAGYLRLDTLREACCNCRITAVEGLAAALL